MTKTSAEAGLARTMIVPLALAQFIASYAATNMNVAISAIATDLDTSVRGLQTTITLFTLTMASLMIPGSKLSDIWGRKVCFIAGLVVYGTGATLAMYAQGLGLMIFGYSPPRPDDPPVYILITVAPHQDRASTSGWSAAPGFGCGGRPAGGRLVTTRQLAGLVRPAGAGRRRHSGDGPQDRRPRVPVRRRGSTSPAPSSPPPGCSSSSSGSCSRAPRCSPTNFTIGDITVIPAGGISPVWLFVVVGALILLWFFLHIRSRERRGQEPLLHLRLFRDRIANLATGTQTVQWLILQGTFFVTSVFLQEIRGYSAIETGLMLTPATVGILVSSAAAGRLAQRHPQRVLIISGFVVTATGMALQLALVREDSSVLSFVPGLLLMGLGVGVMLTSSVNVVQSSFPDADQGDISGLSRSVSNLGSSLGTALAGSILVAAAIPGGIPYALATAALLVIALIGLALAILIPRQPAR